MPPQVIYNIALTIFLIICVCVRARTTLNRQLDQIKKMVRAIFLTTSPTQIYDLVI